MIELWLAITRRAVDNNMITALA